MQPSHRDRFDALLEDAIAALPPRLHELIAEIPVVVDDRPPRELVRSLRREWGDDDESVSDDEVAAELCGLHSGVPLTEQTVEAPALTSDIPSPPPIGPIANGSRSCM